MFLLFLIIDTPVTELSLSIVGALDESEVSICNSLSVNLHLLLLSFYRPTKQKYKIIMEEYAFCSDHHIIKSQLQYHNLLLEDALIQLKPRNGEYLLREEDIENCIHEHGNELALIFLPGVQFYTGQVFNMKRISELGHQYNAMVGFDLAHAVGNIPLSLHEWKVDFGAWCTYKYLNAGPGAIGGMFVHKNHHEKSLEELPRLCGWWGQQPMIRFQMQSTHQIKPGAQGRIEQQLYY